MGEVTNRRRQVQSVAISADGSVFATGEAGKVVIRDERPGRFRVLLPTGLLPGNAPYILTLSADRRRIAGSESAPGILIWNAADGRLAVPPLRPKRSEERWPSAPTARCSLPAGRTAVSSCGPLPRANDKGTHSDAVYVRTWLSSCSCSSRRGRGRPGPRTVSVVGRKEHVRSMRRGSAGKDPWRRPGHPPAKRWWPGRCRGSPPGSRVETGARQAEGRPLCRSGRVRLAIAADPQRQFLVWLCRECRSSKRPADVTDDWSGYAAAYASAATTTMQLPKAGKTIPKSPNSSMPMIH